MSGAELDLDRSDPGPSTAGGAGLPVVALLGLALAGLAAGTLAGALLTPAGAPRLPPVAALDARDVYLDVGTAPATAAPAAVPTLVLRVRVENPGRAPVRFTRLTVEGVGRQPIAAPLQLSVPAGGQANADVTVRPDCVGLQLPARAALHRTAGPGEPAGTVPVEISRGLAPPGAVCQLFEAGLPRGWRDPVLALSIRRVGENLQITTPDLSGERLNGLFVDGRFLATVVVGDHLISTSAELVPGRDTVFTLRGPPSCPRAEGANPLPTTLRLLAGAGGGLQPKLVVAGPDLTRWLRSDCPS